jgi:hypothetical protein
VGPFIFGWLLEAGLNMLQLAAGSLVVMLLATINALRGARAVQGGSHGRE